ncbi:GNAT family N-acetyltransferase [Acinetobacter sp. YH12090]|uniref:GNAT family N-acetyltransferase n=1 Tax=Acinetobacter sp. YH12090 TaxID=2601081 RepID=UPI0015D440CC|nr:GNAT family N-acetyltransferase [Acinetobacter sp. YH12090]
MFVRAAELRDVPILVDFGKKLTQESERFQRQGFSESNAEQVFARLIEQKGSIFVALNDEFEVVGTIIGAMDVDWRTGQTLAYEQGVYVLPEYRKTGAARSLIKGFETWAKLHKADRISLGTITGIKAERTVSLYESLGFELVGYVLEKEL